MTSSNPCKSAYSSARCPPIRDSDSDNEVVSLTDLSEDNLISLSFTRNSKPLDHIECLFVDCSASEGTRVDSIEKLKTNADQLTIQIEEFKIEKELVHNQIRQKKRLLIYAILKVVEYENSIQAVEAAIGDKLHNFQTRMIGLETKRMDIFLESGDAKVRELLEREIEEVKGEFEQRSTVDDAERDQLIQQAQTFAASLGNVVNEFRNYFEEMILESELQKTSDEAKAMEKKFNDDMTQLIRLINRPDQFCNDKAGSRFYVNFSKEKVFKIDTHSSEYKLNAEGVRERIKDGFKMENDGNGEFYIDLSYRKIYAKYYFEDEFGRFYIDVYGHRHYKADPEASEYMLFNGNWKKVKDGTYETDKRGLRVKPKPPVETEEQVFEMTTKELSSKMQDDDLNYIKEAVGPSIRKALAAVVLHQPADPINYFANFLLNYRYNQHMFEKCNEELKYYLELCEQLKEGEGGDDCQ